MLQFTKNLSSSKPPLLPDQIWAAIRTEHYRLRIENAYFYWIQGVGYFNVVSISPDSKSYCFFKILLQNKLSHPLKKYILFHNKRHPAQMGKAEVQQFLNHLAVKEKVATSTQNQALCAIVFLYKHVLQKELGDLIWAKKPKRLPVVFTRKEVQAILNQLTGMNWLMGVLLYGAGLRLTECLQLRVKDIDFEYKQITVHSVKGAKDRVTTPLPEKIIEPLNEHLKYVKELHEKDLKHGFTSVYLPYALERKYLNAGKDLGWKFVFPATQISTDPRSKIQRQHHIHESVLQKDAKQAINAQSWLEWLESAQQDFEAVYQEKIAAEEAEDVPLLTDTRKELIRYLNRLLSYLDINSEIRPEKFNPVVEKIDEIIVDVMTIARERKSKANNSKVENP